MVFSLARIEIGTAIAFGGPRLAVEAGITGDVVAGSLGDESLALAQRHTPGVARWRGRGSVGSRRR